MEHVPPLVADLIMKFSWIVTVLIVWTGLAFGEVPVAHNETVLSPSPGRQPSTMEGVAVATDGTRIVTGAVAASFRLHGEGAANVYDATSGELLITLPNPNPYYGFGEAVAISGSLVVVGSTEESTGAFKAGSVYVFDLGSPTPKVPIAVLHNPRPFKEAGFGSAVSISGRKVVVGAPTHDEGLSYPSLGIAYVYDLASQTPEEPQFVLENPSPSFASYFGREVSISGDRVAVAAPFANRGTSRTGSVYLYDLTGASPTAPSRVLQNQEEVTSARFGFSMAMSGSRLAVGVFYDNTFEDPRSGTAYVYDLGSPTPDVPLLTAEGAPNAADKYFANSIAISGTRVVVGSAYSPSCVVYDLASPAPAVPIAAFARPSGYAGNRYGTSVGIAGTQVIVGAPYYNGGSAFVYDVAGSNPPEAAVKILSATLPSLGDNFGHAVAMTDGYMVVGAQNDDIGAENAGGAYIFPLEGGRTTSGVISLSNPTPGEGDRFGHSTGVSGTTVVIGAPYDDTGAANAGAAYVYDLAGDTPSVPVLTLPNPRPSVSDYFGFVVAVSGPYVVVGAPYEDAAFPDAGAAYVYDLRSPTPQVPVAALQSPSLAAGDNFGISVSISELRVVVGVNCADRGASNAGTAYVFDIDAANPALPVMELPNPEPTQADNFGGVVTINGDFVAVAAMNDDAGLVNAGSVYVYDLTSNQPAVPFRILHHPAPTGGATFGAALAISQGKLLVGASRQQVSVFTTGAAYLYEITGSGGGVPMVAFGNPTPGSFDFFGGAVAMHGGDIGIGSYSDDTPTIDRGVVHLYTAEDVATDAPHLIRPRSDTSNRNLLGVAFTLFEPASEGSLVVSLTNADRVWSIVLGAAYERAGTHDLQLNLADPKATPGVIAATGGPIPDGTYDVTVSFSDLERHASASVTATSVVIDNVVPIVGPVGLSSNNPHTSWAGVGSTVNLNITVSEPIKPPTVILGGAAVSATGGPAIWTASLPVTSITPEGPISFSIVCEDLAGNVAQPVTETSNATKVTVDHTPPVVQAPELVRALATTVTGAAVDFDVSATDNLDPAVRLNVSHRSGAVFPLGVTTVRATAEDAAGHTASIHFDVVVRLENAVKTAVFAKGESVPNAGQPFSRVPAGAAWVSFGAPSLLGSSGYEAITGFAARISSPGGLLGGIFSGPVAAPVARLLVGDAATDSMGQLVESTTFRSFRDPVFASAENFAVIARIHGPAVKQSTSDGIWAGDATGVFEVARRGSPAPGIDGTSFASFSTVLMPASDRVYFVASLKGRDVMRASDSSLWYWSKETGAQLVQREGTASPDGAGGGEVKSFLTLHAVKGSAGHGRYDDQLMPGLLTRKDKSQVVVTFEGANTAVSDFESGMELMPGLAIKSLGFPSLLPGASGLSLRAILGPTEFENGSFEPAVLRDRIVVARKGSPAPGVAGGVFEDFADPVTGLAAQGERADLFVGRISGPQVRTDNDQGIWSYQGETPGLGLIAREGAEAPECDGAVYRSFTSLTLLSGRGPLFAATLSGGSPRIKHGTDAGLWGTDAEGTLRLLLRNGDEIAGRTVKQFRVLEVIPGSAAQQRAWARTAPALVLTRCFFVDGSQAIVQVVIP